MFFFTHFAFVLKFLLIIITKYNAGIGGDMQVKKAMES